MIDYFNTSFFGGGGGGGEGIVVFKNIRIFSYFLLFYTIYFVCRPMLSFSIRRVSDVCKQLTSLLVSRVSYLSPWTRQNFPAQLKIELTL